MPSRSLDLSSCHIHVSNIIRNAPRAALYELALRQESGTELTDMGALVALSGDKTGRSPSDKRIVDHAESRADIWWGPVNIRLDPSTFAINRERAIDYLNTRDHLYCVDAYAGWDPNYRKKVRIVCARAYHALFMTNMLIVPPAEELEDFEPDYVIFNAGAFPANRLTEGMTSATSVDLSLNERQFVILGTEYAGEMKKGVFTIMNYLMPKAGVLSMHCSVTEGEEGDVSVLFGLSGTGKTTLSADPRRQLIGDDEHCWSERGVFNIEGGCYAKVAHLSEAAEPEIYRALRFGSVLENVTVDPRTRGVNFEDTSLTENTRASYPIEHIERAKIPCVAGHPSNVIFLTCDAFGVLPPVSKLTPEQAMYHFISGYTAKVAGTEMGVSEPEATFSPCFGGPFLMWHPARYAELLAERLQKHDAQTWLVNTGWSGGGFGTGQRIRLAYTRAILAAIHSGELASADTVADPVFGFQVPNTCSGVPSEILLPRGTWPVAEDYDRASSELAQRFQENFIRYTEACGPGLAQAGPRP